VTLRFCVGFVVCALLFACNQTTARNPFAAEPDIAQPVSLDFNANGRGQLMLSMTHEGAPFTVDPNALSFYWDKGSRADVHLVDSHSADLPLEPPFETHFYQYAATVVFASLPSKVGLHVLHVRPSPRFARTAAGPLPLPVNSFSIWVWRPDEAGADRGLQAMRARYLGRTIYAFGGARVGCHDRDTVYLWQSGLRVTRVEREKSRIDMLVTGTTLSELPGTSTAFSFFAIHPVKLWLLPTLSAKSPGGNGVSSDREIPCNPGMRFADPWHAEITVTTALPPRNIRAIHIGSTRADVLWLSGYPNVYGTPAQFQRMNTWSYHLPAPSSWYVQFRNGRVVRYWPPRMPP
jgi:hypothetical protein